MTSLREVTRYLDEELRLGEIPDEPNAVNGLQLDAGTKDVTRVACAVDAGEASLEAACQLGANLLIVHHGLLWGGNRPFVGPHGRKLKRCFDAGMSVYSAHLPLDVHPVLGNNAGIVRALGLTADGTFGKFQAIEIGLTAGCDLSLGELSAKIRAAVGEHRVAGRGPDRIRRLGICSGGAGSYASAAARAGLDALLTGEGAHHTAIEAEERGIHLILAGHYRTETFGVKAVGERLASKFGVGWSFLEHDTGL
ncbi:MAG TPA: Nif3-like dinuclear metal center hexameric protein [Myxococcales bacterium]|jgi:dinuclear metal center YbgI/SA1388 family protein